MELQIIQNRIYEIRGSKVMLDFHLAEMYGIETKVLKQSVKRNIKRFIGEDFMFELTREEYNFLRSQFVTLETGRGKYSKYLPYAFTVHGAVMLSNVLQNDRAIDTSIKIVRAFNAMSEVLQNIPQPVEEIKELQGELKQLKQYVEEVFADYNCINEDNRMELELINRTLADLQSKTKWLDNPGKPHWN